MRLLCQPLKAAIKRDGFDRRVDAAQGQRQRSTRLMAVPCMLGARPRACPLLNQDIQQLTGKIWASLEEPVKAEQVRFIPLVPIADRLHMPGTPLAGFGVTTEANDQPWTLDNKLCATIQSPDLTDQQCNEYASGI